MRLYVVRLNTNPQAVALPLDHLTPTSYPYHAYSQEAASWINLAKATKYSLFVEAGFNGVTVRAEHSHIQRELPNILLQSSDFDVLSHHALLFPAQISPEYTQLKVNYPHKHTPMFQTPPFLGYPGYSDSDGC